MNAKPPGDIFYGFKSALEAFSNTSDSGPWPDMHECKLADPGTNPSSLASYTPYKFPINSLMVFL